MCEPEFPSVPVGVPQPLHSHRARDSPGDPLTWRVSAGLMARFEIYYEFA